MSAGFQGVGVSDPGVKGVVLRNLRQEFPKTATYASMVWDWSKSLLCWEAILGKYQMEQVRRTGVVPTILSCVVA